MLDGGKYRNLVYERWAASHGIEYKIWASPSNISRYHRNLQFIYQNWDEDLNGAPRGLCCGGKAALHGAKSIAFLMEEIPWFNAGVAAGLLADRLVHGPIGHIPITDTRNFLLSLSQEQAEAIAAECCKNINNLYAEASGPVALASSVDVAKAVARLKKLECLAREGKRATPKMRKLEERVRLARAEGRNPLDDLITNYAKCGNRSSRLTHAQSELVRGVIGSHWLKGKVATLADLYRELALQCECAGVPVPGRKALVRRVRSVSRGNVILLSAVSETIKQIGRVPTLGLDQAKRLLCTLSCTSMQPRLTTESLHKKTKGSKTTARYCTAAVTKRRLRLWPMPLSSVPLGAKGH